jgi:hypothetical protein
MIAFLTRCHRLQRLGRERRGGSRLKRAGRLLFSFIPCEMSTTTSICHRRSREFRLFQDGHQIPIDKNSPLCISTFYSLDAILKAGETTIEVSELLRMR